LYLKHVERGNPNEVWVMVDTLSKPTVKKAEALSGTGRIKKQKLLAERQQEMITEQIGPKTEIPMPKGG
jgi:hypothetical protein